MREQKVEDSKLRIILEVRYPLSSQAVQKVFHTLDQAPAPAPVQNKNTSKVALPKTVPKGLVCYGNTFIFQFLTKMAT